jgi:hypothetical protein
LDERIKPGEWTSALLQAPKDSLMKILPLFVLGSSAPILMSRRENWYIPWALRHPWLVGV